MFIGVLFVVVACWLFGVCVCVVLVVSLLVAFVVCVC